MAAALFVLVAGQAGIAQEITQSAVVVADTSMYWMRDVSRTPMRILATGARVQVTQREGDWYKVVYYDPRYGDDIGYVPVASLELQGNANRDSFGSSGSQMVSQRGFVEGRGFLFPQEAVNDTTRAIGEALLREEVFVKPARWVQFAGGVDLRGSTHGQVEDEWRFDADDRGILRPRAALRRLTATLSTGRLRVDVGKQFIRWGRADILNPTDRFAPRDYVNVLDSDFLAVTGVRPSLRLGSETLEAVWLPRMTPSRLPIIDHRWTVLPPEAAGISIEDGGSIFPKGREIGARWSHTGRFEAGLSFFDGFNHLPDIAVQPLTPTADPLAPVAVSVTRLYPALRTYGGELAVPTRWVTIKSEAAFFTFPESAAREQYALYVIELERQMGEWLFDGGYAGEAVTRSGVEAGFGAERGIAKSFLGRASYTVDPRRTVAIEGAVRQSGDGQYVKGEYSQSYGQHLRLTVAGVGIGGNASDFLGQYRRNSHASVSLRYSY